MAYIDDCLKLYGLTYNCMSGLLEGEQAAQIIRDMCYEEWDEFNSSAQSTDWKVVIRKTSTNVDRPSVLLYILGDVGELYFVNITSTSIDEDKIPVGFCIPDRELVRYRMNTTVNSTNVLKVHIWKLQTVPTDPKHMEAYPEEHYHHFTGNAYMLYHPILWKMMRVKSYIVDIAITVEEFLSKPVIRKDSVTYVQYLAGAGVTVAYEFCVTNDRIIRSNELVVFTEIIRHLFNKWENNND